MGLANIVCSRHRFICFSPKLWDKELCLLVPGRRCLDSWCLLIILEDFKLYVCPSFSLLGRVPRKLKLEEVSDALIIAPCLPTAHWYPQLPELLLQRPALLPQWETLLPLPQEDVLHPLREMIQLTAWHVTEIAWRSEEFLRGQPIMCSSLGDSKQYSTVWKVFLLLVWEETEKSVSDRSGDNLQLFYCTVWKFQQDAVGAYIWAWLYYAYDTFNMPYCS